MGFSVANAVTSNQESLYKNLEAVVRKYAATTFLRPVADHTRKAFDKSLKFIQDFYADKADREDSTPCPLVLDSGCGTGESTLHLARRFPHLPVIGIDKSAVRLTKAENSRPEIPPNAFWIRGELLDFWRLALEQVKSKKWKIIHHALYYPNPWPKESEATRRFHLHPIFPTLLQLSPSTELRTNWEIYAQEFAEAARIATNSLNISAEINCNPFAPTSPETAFERKYQEAGQQLWKTTVVL